MTREDALVKAIEDFRQHNGKTVLASMVNGYIGDDSVELAFDPPIAVRITGPTDPQQGIAHFVDHFLDPYWDVEVLDTAHPQLDPNFGSCWIYGISYNLETNETIPVSEWKLPCT